MISRPTTLVEIQGKIRKKLSLASCPTLSCVLVSHWPFQRIPVKLKVVVTDTETLTTAWSRWSMRRIGKVSAPLFPPLRKITTLMENLCVHHIAVALDTCAPEYSSSHRFDIIVDELDS